MIKKRKEKKSKLEMNPFLYYVTNWGFVELVKKKDQKK